MKVQKRMPSLLLPLIAAACVLSLRTSWGATTYFVDSRQGDDAADGRSEATAWRSLERANAAALQPGDRMLFRRGGEWRGQLSLCSGAPGSRTYYGAYGTGPKPVFRGSVPRDREDDWVSVGPGLWSTRFGSRGTDGECLRDAQALAKGWHASYESTVKGAMRTVLENGESYLHVACTEAPADGGARNHLQLWGPSIEGLPTTLMLRFKVRGGFFPKKATVILPRPPYTIAAEDSVVISEKADSNGWYAAEALIHADKTVFGPNVLHFYLGAFVRTGKALDIKFTGLYRFNIDERAYLGRDVGILLFDGGAAWGFKKWTLKDLRDDLDYWYDESKDRVVVKLDRNPARAHKSVELALTQVVIPHRNRHDVTVEAFTIRDSGGFAFGGHGAADLTVRNCDICYIGGGLQYWKKQPDGTQKPVRYGNGIEFWSPARDCLVERCRFWQIYDAAVTPQQSRSTNGFDRITFRDNVFWQCEYSYEYWNHDPASHSFDIVFEHNTSVDAGACWSHSQRPNPNGAHLMSYVHVGAMRNQVIRNNVFCRSTDRGFRFFTDWRKDLAMDHNLHYEPLNVLSQSHVRPGAGLAWKFGAGSGEFARYRDATGLDAGSVYGEPQFVNPAVRDYRLKPGTIGTDLATDGGPVGARNMPGIDRDQSVMDQARDVVMYVGAHPDDLEAVMGLALRMKDDFDFRVVDFTRGEGGCGPDGFRDGSTARTRMAEERTVCARLGCEPPVFLGETNFQGRLAFAGRAVTRELEDLIWKLKPKAIITHWPVDTHPDHVQCSAAVQHAVYNLKRDRKFTTELYFNEEPPWQTLNYRPTYYVDVTAVETQALDLVRCYVCQNGGKIAANKAARMRERGAEAPTRVTCAETYTTLSGKPIAGGVLERYAIP